MGFNTRPLAQRPSIPGQWPEATRLGQSERPGPLNSSLESRLESRPSARACTTLSLNLRLKLRLGPGSEEAHAPGHLREPWGVARGACDDCRLGPALRHTRAVHLRFLAPLLPTSRILRWGSRQ